jgi:hypothetical protein
MLDQKKPTMINRKWIGFIITGAVVFIGISFYAPRYLTYSDIPKRSDAIILLPGPDFKDKRKEVHDLIGQGLADYLIIPVYHEILKVVNKGKPVPIDYLSMSKSSLPQEEIHRHVLYENTHKELVEAKTMVDTCGFRSAIIVSSRYHMRRLKIIAEKVFKGNDYRLYFVPTRYEKRHGIFWFLTPYDLKWVGAEYPKIAWFLLYLPFSSL